MKQLYANKNTLSPISLILELSRNKKREEKRVNE